MTTLGNLPDPWEAAEQYAAERPFPHLVIDNAYNEVTIARAAAEFPPPDDTRWHTFTGPSEHGKQEAAVTESMVSVSALHRVFGSETFVSWLSVVVAIPDLVADPDRVGGGIHQSGPGARLGLHLDFNLHPRNPQLVRAVNLILFLTDTHDGWLHLGPDDGSGRVQLAPRAGRLVIFAAGDDTWHGHPEPMMSRPLLGAVLRKSIPAYYYRPVRDDETIVARSTRFLDA